MITYDQSSIITAIIGMLGLMSTAVILISAFKRNRTGTGKWQ